MKPNKLTTMFLLVILMGIMQQFANAQIVYTDIKDATYTCDKKCGKNCYSYVCSKTYALGLNNDGATDFNINTGREVSNFDGGNGTYCCINGFSNGVSIMAFNDNSVLVTSGSAAAVMTGSDISSASAWSASGSGNFNLFNLRSVSRNCKLDFLGGCVTIPSEINWPNSTDRYLGLKIILNGQTYYGWARLSVVVDENKASFKIKDYAYESTPGASIVAGDMGTQTNTRSPGNNIPEENTNKIKLRVSPNPVSSSAVISFSLPAAGKVSINLYDIAGRLIKTLTDKKYNEGVHQITLDSKELNAGIYLLRLQSPEAIETKKIILIK